MKKLYFILLLSLLNVIAYAQSTVDIFANAPATSFVTGDVTTTAKTPDGMTLIMGSRRGWAVFDLSSIPPSATVTAVDLHFYITSVTGFGAPNTSLIRKYDGDISLLTPIATLYTATTAASPTIWTTTWPTVTGPTTITSVAAAVAFVQANLGGKASFIWANGTSRNYVVKGESGLVSTTGVFAPFIRVTYTCAGMTTASATPSPTRICLGSAVGLSSAASGAVNYSWSGPGGFTSTNQVTSAIPPAAGNNTYTVTASNAAGCGLKAFATVTVNPLPAPIISASGATAFCTGGNVTLTAAPAGLNYQWLKDGLPIAFATSSTYTASTSGSYKVVATDAQGCSGTSGAVPVYEITTPTITPSGAVVLCSGGTVPITVNTGGVTSGITFQWYNGTTLIPGATNSTYAATTSGDYSVIVSAGASCSGTSIVANVTINGLPTPAVSFNGTQVLTSNTFASYQWFLNMSAIPGATSYAVVPPANGNYRVLVTATNGCSNYSPSLAIGNVGIDEVNSTKVNIYPNPANSIVFVDAPVKVRAMVSSIEGKMLVDQKNASEIDITSLSNGIYLISVFDENNRRLTTQKLIKQ